MRRHYRTSMWFWVVSLATIPFWIMNIPADDWFRWAKNLSVILPLIYAGIGRIAAVQQKDTPFWRLMRQRWVRWVLYGIVFCNIAEATLRDVEMGNYMNALAGFILCVTMPFGDPSTGSTTPRITERSLPTRCPCGTSSTPRGTRASSMPRVMRSLPAPAASWPQPSSIPSSSGSRNSISPAESTPWAYTCCYAAASRCCSPPS